MVIYKATNQENGKIYIGQTIQPFEVRKAHHEYGHRGFYFGNALKKYDFDWDVIRECETIDELNKWEKYYIKKYKSTNKLFGYNLRRGGNGGGSHSEWARKNMSKMRRGVPKTEHWKKKVREAWKKKGGHSKESKEKISRAMKNRVVTEDHKKNLSKSLKKTFNTLEMKEKLKLQAEKQWKKIKNDSTHKWHSLESKKKRSLAATKMMKARISDPNFWSVEERKKRSETQKKAYQIGLATRKRNLEIKKRNAQATLEKSEE